MSTISAEQFLQNISNQIYQYVYRSLEPSFDPMMAFLQEASKVGALNWHLDTNKEKLKQVFTGINEAIDSYSISDGDFRTYLTIKLTQNIVEIYKTELLGIYAERGYNVTPESVIGAITDAYSKQKPQNTNFPDTANTSNEVVPEPSGIRLVPKSIYQDDVFP